MKQHITRAYNRFEIDKEFGIITKFSKNDRLLDEIYYYKGLKACRQTPLFPRYIDSNIDHANSFTNEEKWLKLEYYGYKNLAEIMLHDKFDENFWEIISDKILNHLNTFFYSITPEIENSAHREMYVDKTEKYYNELINNFEIFKQITSHNEIIINREHYLNFHMIWQKIKNIIEEKFLKNCHYSNIHGDMCFSNILVGYNEKSDTHIIRYIDPRGRWGSYRMDMGDKLYDYAKLSHSYNGNYEQIIYDNFDLLCDSDYKSFTYNVKNNIYFNIKKIFEKKIKQNLNDIKLVEGLIFIGMCSRHYDSQNRQIAMYLTGIKLLNEVLQG